MEEALKKILEIFGLIVLWIIGLFLRRWTYRNVYGKRGMSYKDRYGKRRKNQKKKRLRLFRKIGKQVNK